MLPDCIGFGDCSASNPSHQQTRYPETAENHSNGCLRCWNLVRTPPSLRTLTHESSVVLTDQSTCLISILRLAYIYPLTVSPDFTWNSPLPTIWSCVETNTAILCSCVPTFKGLVQRFFPKLLASLQDRNKDSAATASTEDSIFKSTDSEKSAPPLWSVGQKLSVSNFSGVRGARHMDAYYNSRISEDDEERFVAELSNIPGKW